MSNKPYIATRELVIFPETVTPIFIGRDDSSHINLWLEADAKPWEIFQYILQEESK